MRAGTLHLFGALAALGEVTPFLLHRRDPAARQRPLLADAVFLPPRLGGRWAAILAADDQPLSRPPGLAEVAGPFPAELPAMFSEPAALLRHAMNRRRLERLLGRLHRLRPGVIVLDGAALAPLVPALHSLGCPIAWRAAARGSVAHRALAEGDPPGAAWHRAAARAFDAAERLAAPWVDQLWLPSPEAGQDFAGLIPTDRHRVLPPASQDLPPEGASSGVLAEAIGEAIRELGLSPSPPAKAAFAVLAEGEALRFNPVTRLLDWSFLMQGATGASVRLVGDDGAVLDHGFILLHPGRRGVVRVEALGVLPAGAAPQALSMEITLPGDRTHRHRPPAPVEERAGLAALTPAEGRFELLAWSLDEAPALRPAPVGREDLPRPPGALRLLRARIDLPPETPVLAVEPGRGSGQVLHGPSVWTRPRPPSSARLRDLAGRHGGETAWIIGNGPSVRHGDLDALEGRLTFCFNRFHLAHATTRLRPRYTVTGDRQMIEDFGEEIVARSGGTVFLADAAPPAIVGDYIWVRHLPVFPPLFSLRPEIGVSPGGSSLLVALQLAYMMGVRRFMLYGTDFSYRFVPTNDPDPFRSAAGEGNHFIPDYRSGQAWCPPALRDITAGFLAARCVIEAGGGMIRNASRGGLLEIFDRLPFETALALR